ncbi:metal ABC transporter permease [Sulfuriflexus sp.]|uniref:metal ABC transporter permease n=1 Tax=Sulfuriflexus sp. TaxID=2015443 RepID=UPI0028CCAB91|nr:metal ABC transporter permease [Sulfuriflexus sp.]MDT8405050.1 metal ABC transporter permease [Sulfuriflexus sp.]
MLEFSVILAPLIAGLLVIATHVPLGREVLKRGIIFIDLAIAQIAGLGVIAAQTFEFEMSGYGVQLAAGASALAGGLLLQWSERRWPDIQEALIGTIFVLAACASLLLLAGNPHGAEHLQELLAGQILWVRYEQLPAASVLFALVLGLWFFAGNVARGKGFYLLFALAVTASVQLVGIYLVFASLIIPALAARRLDTRWGLYMAYAVGAGGYLAGLLLSVTTDLPAAPLIVWALAVFSMLGAWLLQRYRRVA